MRVLIVDDHPVTRDGMRAALADSSEVEIVGEAASGEEAVTAAKALGPDVVFMDVDMAGMSGMDAARTILRDRPGTKIILLTVEDSPASIADAIRSGVSGYLLKDVAAEDLVRAAKLAIEGKAIIHPALTRVLLDEVRFHPGRPGLPLSEREIQILQQIASGRSTRQVARDLGISANTVKTHLERIFDKLGANDRAQAVAIALREGLVD